MNRNRKKIPQSVWLQFFVGIGFTGMAFYYLLGKFTLRDIIEYSQSVQTSYILITCGLIFLGFLAKAYRWQSILGNEINISFSKCYHPMIIGFMLNFLLPIRIGELVRPSVLKVDDSVPFSLGISAVFIERIYDIACLILLFLIFVFNLKSDMGQSIIWGETVVSSEMLSALFRSMILFVFIFGILILLCSFNPIKNTISSFWGSIRGGTFFFPIAKNSKWKIVEDILDSILNFFERVIAAFSIILNFKKGFIVFLHTLIVWGLASVAQYTFFLGCPGVSLNFFESTAFMTIICFFIAIPSVPGYWGVWEAGGLFAMALFEISVKDAIGPIVVYHVIQIFFTVFLGCISLYIFFREKTHSLKDYKSVLSKLTRS